MQKGEAVTLDDYRNLIVGEECACCRRRGTYRYKRTDLLYPKSLEPNCLSEAVDGVGYPVVLFAHCGYCRHATLVRDIIAHSRGRSAA